MSGQRRTVTEVDGHRITLSNLDKVLFPAAGFTKGDLVNYYVRIAPVLLPHLSGRPVTFVRYPDGVDGGSFFEKRLPPGAPSWVEVIDVPRSNRRDGSAPIHAPAIADLASLVWAANLAAIELHVPLWQSSRAGTLGDQTAFDQTAFDQTVFDQIVFDQIVFDQIVFDQIVFDLDPGAPATIVECGAVAQLLAELLAERELTRLRPKTSGKKGLQLYAPLSPARPWVQVRDLAREIARALERAHPDLVVAKMRKDLRPGKVFIDWSQNHPAKTTVAAYSLRAVSEPSVSTPVTMDEVRACVSSGDPAMLHFGPTAVLERVERLGDLFAFGSDRRHRGASA
jgi:bifunctional non-homologous end joining protein LigD